MFSKLRAQTIDQTAIILSCFCGVHCAVFPILMSMSYFSVYIPFDQHHIHEIMFVLSAIMASFAIWHAYKVHCKHIVTWFTSMGVLFLGIDITIHEFDFYLHVELFGVELLPIFSAMLLVTAHVLNLRYTKASTNCEHCQ